ncbi:MAG: hypothetical protein QOF00_6430 [Pseudonocardiales bacterium]|nr:hypothetical protein [Pseudonocardiales bacterium]
MRVTVPRDEARPDTGGEAPSGSPHSGRSWRQRRLDRRRRVRQDLLAAQAAELHTIRSIAGAAREFVAAGWLQNGWYAHRTPSGLGHVTSAHAAERFHDSPVVAACLVGAIVHAGGGATAAHTQPVQRAITLTWHTLFADPTDRVRWCSPPAERAARVRELTSWNDHPGRAQHHVIDLLRTVEEAAGSHAIDTRSRLLEP